MLSSVPFAVRWALASIQTEFPFQEPIVFLGPGPVALPRARHPVFYGAYDWHSCVHGFWSLLRFLRFAEASEDLKTEIHNALRGRFRADELARETTFLRAHPLFERPYGRAWFLALDAELAHLDPRPEIISEDARSVVRAGAIDVAQGMLAWLHNMAGPDRTGWHSQTAFALGLMFDWAREVKQPDLASEIEAQTRRLFGRDERYAMHLEPAGEDFLSPSLAAADVMRRVLSPVDFHIWFSRALPELAEGHVPSTFASLRAVNADDGRLAHHAGLGFSRAWMLAGISSALDGSRTSTNTLARTALDIFNASVAVVTRAAPTFAITHWVGSFAIFAATHAGFIASNQRGKFAQM